MPYVKGLKHLYDKNGRSIEVEDVVKEVNGNHFWKVNMVDFLASIGLIGNKSIDVYEFILRNLNQRTNKLKMTNKQIQKKMNQYYKAKNMKNNPNDPKSKVKHISLHTISRAITNLERYKVSKNNKPIIMKRRYGEYGRKSYLMANPALLMKGRESHRQGLLIEYKKVGNKKEKSSKKYSRNKKQEEKHNHNKKIIKILNQNFNGSHSNNKNKETPNKEISE